MNVTEMKESFMRAASLIESVAVEVIKAADPLLIHLLQEQLALGLDGNNNHIVNKKTGRGYAYDWYSEYKQDLGSRAPFGTPDLLLTGSMYQKMEIVWIASDQFSIISNDVKWRKLMKQYGLDTMKLSEISIQYFIVNKFQPEFIKLMSALTGAGYS